MRAPRTKRGPRSTLPTVSARLLSHVTLETRANGKIAACFGGYSVGLGTFGAGAAEAAQTLRTGLSLSSLASGRRTIDKDVDSLVRRLARHGLLEYCLQREPDREEQVVIEPQMSDYWPRSQPLADTDRLALSRFAYMRRRGGDMVLESPRAGALFRICDPKVAAVLATLSTPQQIKALRQRDDVPDDRLTLELLALLVDCHILFKIDRAEDEGLRPDEGDDNLVLWDFHDLLFHARATQGRHANPLGGVLPYAGLLSPRPAVRPAWPGPRIDLAEFSNADPTSPVAKLLRERHSTRGFDGQKPITLAELARCLDGTARVLSRWDDRIDLGEGGPVVEYAKRPYPSAGASYALELYLAVHACDGLARGFYHYDAGAHALAAIHVEAPQLDTLLAGAEFAMDAPGPPQVLITIAARFGRMSWKYSSIAYALVLKDVGVLTQTLYLMATDMGLGGCAIGSVDIDLFATMTGIEFHIEGAVGQFALGRPATPVLPD